MLISLHQNKIETAICIHRGVQLKTCIKVSQRARGSRKNLQIYTMISAEVSEDMSADTSADISADTSADISADISADTPADIFAEICADASADIFAYRDRTVITLQ